MAVDFNLAQPQPGSSPIGALRQGLNNGLSLGLGLRQQRMAEEKAKQQALMEQEEIENKKFSQAIDILTNKDMRKLLGKNTQKALLKAAAPGFSKNYGIDLPVDQIEVDDNEGGPLDNLLGLIKAGADPSVIKHQYQMDVLNADDETLPLLKEFGDSLGSDSMTEYQKAMIALRQSQFEDKKSEKEQKKLTAKTRMSDNLSTLKSLYEELDREGGIVDARKSGVSNISRKISSSGIGQAVGGVFGTKEQSIRNQIHQIRPLLIQDIRQATEMGARGLDSNTELNFYMQAATDPTKDIQYNMAALSVLDRAYGLGLGINVDKKYLTKLRSEYEQFGVGDEDFTPEEEARFQELDRKFKKGNK